MGLFPFLVGGRLERVLGGAGAVDALLASLGGGGVGAVPGGLYALRLVVARVAQAKGPQDDAQEGQEDPGVEKG